MDVELIANSVTRFQTTFQLNGWIWSFLIWEISTSSMTVWWVFPVRQTEVYHYSICIHHILPAYCFHNLPNRQSDIVPEYR